VPLGLGVALGIAGSIFAGGVLQQFLYEVRPGDPQVIGAIALLMGLVGALAGWLPPGRAAALDALVALKED
jgi:hypothetical protein